MRIKKVPKNQPKIILTSGSTLIVVLFNQIKGPGVKFVGVIYGDKRLIEKKVAVPQKLTSDLLSVEIFS